MSTMTRTWTVIAEVYNASEEQRQQISAIIDALEWRDWRKTMPFAQGYAIQNAVRELRIPQVSQIAWNGTLSFTYSDNDEGGCYGIYGVEGHYKNGRARVYLLDRGADVMPLATDFWANGN